MKAALLAAIAAATMIGLAETSRAARADDPPYCAVAGGRNAYENCGYYTLGQCLAAVSGVGGHCQPNPRYLAPRAYSDEMPHPARRSR
jgi:hypothetical protein